MSATYIVRAPSNGVHNGEQFSQKTANADLSSTNWAASADGADSTQYLCPRAFIPKADGILVVTPLDGAATNVYVLAGLIYPIAIKAITRTGTATALQIADAVTLLY